MQTQNNSIIPLIAGGIAGTTGAVLTCPLEVIKTRLQAHTETVKYVVQSQNICLNTHTHQSTSASTNGYFIKKPFVDLNRFQILKAKFGNITNPTIYVQLQLIIKNEGFSALFKGLMANLLGVAPYRAIYFFMYSNAKTYLMPLFKEDNSKLHISSAYIAGFTAVTLTNPIWFVKTRIQLDKSKHGTTASSLAKSIYNEKGILGFYKGISASYVGTCETALYFLLYERFKKLTVDSQNNNSLASYATSSSFSKMLAACLCYPHEVIRTRLRQEGNKYTGLMQTLCLIKKEEGFKGFYKGMGTHLIRQIPNNIIVMTTYELIVNYFMSCE